MSSETTRETTLHVQYCCLHHINALGMAMLQRGSEGDEPIDADEFDVLQFMTLFADELRCHLPSLVAQDDSLQWFAPVLADQVDWNWLSQRCVLMLVLQHYGYATYFRSHDAIYPGTVGGSSYETH